MSGEGDRYGFAGFVLERSQRRLLRGDGTSVALTPRLFSALLLFVDRAGELLDKEALMAALWPGLVVEENNLSQVVHGLRRALGDEGGQLIQTVPRHGFRFATGVTVLPAAAAAGGSALSSGSVDAGGIAQPGEMAAPSMRGVRPRRPVWWSAALSAALAAVVASGWLALGRLPDRPAAPATFSVAVLPMRASGEPPDMAYAESFTSELTAALSQNRLLAGAVAAGGAVSRHGSRSADLGALAGELKVRYAVDGEASRQGDNVVTTLSLIDVQHARQLWTRRIETPTVKVASWPSLPVLRATAAVRRALYEAEMPRIVESPRGAFERVLLAERNDTGTEQGVLRARASCNEALRADPELPAALACRAWSLYAEAELGPNPRFAEMAREADDLSRRAVFMTVNDPYVWAVRARVLAQMLHQWDSALEANTRAMLLDPSHARYMVDRALYLIWMGRPEEAFPFLDRAADIDGGLSASIDRIRCRAQLTTGRFKEAVASCERSAGHDDFWTVHVYLACAYGHLGDVQRASVERERVLRHTPEFSIDWIRRLTRQFTDEPKQWEQWEKGIGSGLRKAGFREL